MDFKTTHPEMTDAQRAAVLSINTANQLEQLEGDLLKLALLARNLKEQVRWIAGVVNHEEAAREARDFRSVGSGTEPEACGPPARKKAVK